MRRLPALVMFAVGVGLATWPMLSSGLELMECDPGDTRLLNYVLEHGYRWLLGRAELFSPPFFWPERGVGPFTELMVGTLPLYAPWRLLGFEPDTSFQLWMFAVLSLNFVAAHALFARALKLEPVPAAAGAFIIAFGSSRMAQLNHQHLLPVFFAVLAVHALVRIFEGGPRAWVPVFFFGAVAQLWASVTLGWLFGFWLLVLLGWSLALRVPRAAVLHVVRERRAPLLMSGAVAAVLLVPLAVGYGGAGPRDFEGVRAMVPQLQSWLYQGPYSVLYAPLAELSVFTQLPSEGEHRIGVGLFTTLVMVVMLRKEPWLRALGLTALTVVALSTLYRGRVSPWVGVMHVLPGADGIRAVGRVGLFMLFPAAVSVALLAKRARPAGLVVVALCLLEQLQRVPDVYSKGKVRSDVAAVTAAVPSTCRAFFYAPRGGDGWHEKTQLDAMWAALWSGVPTVNGYSGHFPPGWEPLFPHALNGPEDEVRVREALAKWAQSRGVAEKDVCWVEVGSR
ncbi:MAG: hypothetical protein JNK82_01725 [Myxococcaceae bacterium]|nr:hypothetical protein [Myxococcaceae bacterium]